MTTEAPQVKVSLTDDHVLLRNALAMLINNFGGYKVILETSTGDDLLKKMHEGIIPDVVLLDLSMPGLGGRETARRLQQHFPDVYVLMLTMYDTETTMLQLLEVGVRGFPKKNLSPLDLKFALDSVMHTGYYHGSDMTGKLINILKRRHESHSVVRKLLTEVEIAFLKQACTQLTYKEIADQMNLHERTIDNIRESLFEKLEMRSRIGLAMYAVKHGISAF
jgi:DNA-binding NarL/FixJ family response regulator